jgi:hypothetical protein
MFWRQGSNVWCASRVGKRRGLAAFRIPYLLDPVPSRSAIRLGGAMRSMLERCAAVASDGRRTSSRHPCSSDASFQDYIAMKRMALPGFRGLQKSEYARPFVENGTEYATSCGNVARSLLWVEGALFLSLLTLNWAVGSVQVAFPSDPRDHRTRTTPRE